MLLALALGILAFGAGFHVYWALGGQTGFGVSLPQRPDGMPVMAHRRALWRPAAGGVALCLVLLATLLLDRTGYVALPVRGNAVRVLLLIAGGALVARSIVPNRYVGLFKTLRTTQWARYDTRLYSPLILLLGGLILCLAL